MRIRLRTETPIQKGLGGEKSSNTCVLHMSQRLRTWPSGWEVKRKPSETHGNPSDPPPETLGGARPCSCRSAHCVCSETRCQLTSCKLGLINTSPWHCASPHALAQHLSRKEMSLRAQNGVRPRSSRRARGEVCSRKSDPFTPLALRCAAGPAMS